MDNATFSKWVEQVLKPYRQGKPRCLMVLDSASAHKSAQSKAVLEETNMEMSIIPGGYTGGITGIGRWNHETFQDIL